jgi:hypothetical protein
VRTNGSVCCNSNPPRLENNIFSAENNPNGKEVILVKYTKPEIVLAADAVSAIQNMTKPFGGPDNEIPELRTTPAYESDE